MSGIIKVTLQSVQSNETFVGTLLLMNLTSGIDLPSSGDVHFPRDDYVRYKGHSDRHRRVDPTGASYYVIAVVLVYGMSAVLLIASHINRRNSKTLEDRQINKYLQEFQIVREKSSREKYRNLKKDIMTKLRRSSTDRQGGLGGCKSIAKLHLLPLSALGLPTIRESRSHHGGADAPAHSRHLAIPRYSINGSLWRQGGLHQEHEIQYNRGGSMRRHSFVRANMWSSIRRGEGKQVSAVACSPDTKIPLEGKISENESTRSDRLSVSVDRVSNLRRLSCPFIQTGHNLNSNNNQDDNRKYDLGSCESGTHLAASLSSTNNEEIPTYEVDSEHMAYQIQCKRNILSNHITESVTQIASTSTDIRPKNLTNSKHSGNILNIQVLPGVARRQQFQRQTVFSGGPTGSNVDEPQHGTKSPSPDSVLRIHCNRLYVPETDCNTLSKSEDIKCFQSQRHHGQSGSSSDISTSPCELTYGKNAESQNPADFTLAASLTVPSLPNQTSTRVIPFEI